MDKLAEMFEEYAGSEPIEFAVIGPHYNDDLGEGPFNDAPVGKLLPWADARKFLEYGYYSGFGGADCHPVYAWTATRVLFVTEYDGATDVSSVPRNPMDCMPGFQG